MRGGSTGPLHRRREKKVVCLFPGARVRRVPPALQDAANENKNGGVFDPAVDAWTAWNLGVEGRTTAASGRGIGIADDELRTLEVFYIVDLGAGQILETHGIDQ